MVEVLACVCAIVGVFVLVYGGYVFGQIGRKNACRVAWNGGYAAATGYLDVLTAQLTRAGGANVWRVAFGWKI